MYKDDTLFLIYDNRFAWHQFLRLRFLGQPSVTMLLVGVLEPVINHVQGCTVGDPSLLITLSLGQN